MGKIDTVKVPPQFEEVFKKAEAAVGEYFKNQVQDPTKGTVTIAGERYILVRAASMSVEFFEIIANLFKDKGEVMARDIATGMLFDIAHSIGKTDAENFAKKMNFKNPIEKLSAGPIHFSYTGWAFVDISPEGRMSADENYFSVYDHPYSFESDAWMKSGVKTTDPICIMSSGYSSGWCEASFGVPLVAIEIECRAAGDPHDRFIMAHPSKIKSYTEEYIKNSGKIARKGMKYNIPGFFKEKFETEELRAKNEELEKLNKIMIDREIKMIELKKEIEKLQGLLAAKAHGTQ